MPHTLLPLAGLLFALCFGEGARILGVFPFAAFSHYQIGDALMKGLAAKGHDVTVVSPFFDETAPKNFRQVVLEGFVEEMQKMKQDLFNYGKMAVVSRVLFLEQIGLGIGEKTYENANVQKLLRSDARFDLVIVHQFQNEALLALCHHYDAPCVLVSSLPAPHWTNPPTGNSGSPSYVPENMLKIRDDMNFFERVGNALTYVYVDLLRHLHTLPKHDVIVHKYFPDAPHVLDFYYNVSLILINSHVSVTPPVPNLPNMIEIGGSHIKAPKPLPKDLQIFLDDAHDGAIYFSLGSNLQSKDLTSEKRAAILRALAETKLKVLWKWENDTLPGQPPNVKISKWLPQQAILAHPNVKLFITQGGLLSCMEAVHHGVPVLGIPVYGDQERNMMQAAKVGYGLFVPYDALTYDKLSAAFGELLNNPKYAANAKERQRIMHDEPMKPLEKGIFWIEYVLRHKGAPHLRSTALQLTWYQYLLLDVAAFLGAIFFIVAFVFWQVCRSLLYDNVKTIKEGKKNN